MKKLILLITLNLFSSVSWAECVEGDCVNSQGAYIYEDGQKYVWQWSDDKSHGKLPKAAEK
jgi:hypothetical protein